tara:strand:- start:786 stop:1235 length:450 start_codon:yes stop_codon:yes gene_type:complete
MMMLRILLCLMFVSTGAWAVEPSEMLADPVGEARARELSKGLRCLVCRNENIDTSNAGIAADLRILVRERITAGDTDAQVIEFVVDRYGEFVLLKPRLSWGNLLLWASGPLMLLIGGLIGWRFTRNTDRAEPDPLNKGEQARLQELLDE